MPGDLERISYWTHQFFSWIRALLEPAKIQKELDLLAKIFFSIFQIAIIILVIAFLAALASFILSGQKGITIMPFDTSGMGEDCSGKAVADRLGMQLQKIRGIHEFRLTLIDPSKNITQEDIEGTSLKSPQFIPPIISNENTMEEKLSKIGTVDAGPASVSIGQLLLILRSMTGRSANSITGSLEVYGSNISIVALMEDRGSEKGTLAWERTIPIESSYSSKEEMIPNLINDLAYNIFYDINNDVKAAGSSKSWISFKYATEGWNAYRNYNVTNDPSYLRMAEEMMRRSLIEDPQNIESVQLLTILQAAYQEIGSLGKLSDLTDIATEIPVLSGDAWYNKGVSAAYASNWKEAEKAFDNATKADPKDKLYWVSKSFALNKLMDDDALTAAEEAIRLDPDYADAWHEKGNALYNLGNYRESIEAHKRSIKLDSSKWWYYYDYALPLWQSGMKEGCDECYDEAIVALDTALRLNLNEDEKDDVKDLSAVIRGAQSRAIGSASRR